MGRFKFFLFAMFALLVASLELCPSIRAGSLDAPPDGKKVIICGHVLQRIEQGLLVTCADDAYARKQIPGAPKGNVIGGELLVGSVVLLKGYPKEASMADHDVIANVIARDTGMLEYESVGGAKKTVHAYQFVTGH